MKKFFEMIVNKTKKLFGLLKSGFKKFVETITNKWLLKGTTTVILVAIVIAAYWGVNYWAEQATVSDIDFTPEKLYSLNDATKQRLDALNTDITIQLINIGKHTFINEYATRYKNASDRITIESIEDVTTRVDLQTKYNIDATTVLIVVKNGDKEKVLTYNDLYKYVSSYSYETVDTTEEAITNAIVEVTIEEKPQVYVLSGKTYYQPETSLGIIANQLIEEAYNIDLLDITTKGNVPENCDCLIITTLKQDLSDLERDAILKYINNGGKILMMTSQSSIDVKTPNFNKILAEYGVTLNYGVVFEQDSSRKLYDTPNMILTYAEASFIENLKTVSKLFVLSPGSIQFADETKLKELNVTYEKIASTSEKSFVRTKFDTDSKTRTENDSKEGSHIIAALANKEILSLGKTSKLIIFSDETFMTPLEVAPGIGYMARQYSNEDLVLNSVSYLTDRDDNIVIRNVYETDTYTVTDQEDAIAKTIIFVTPVLIIGAGVVVWLVRRRKS